MVSNEKSRNAIKFEDGTQRRAIMSSFLRSKEFYVSSSEMIRFSEAMKMHSGGKFQLHSPSQQYRPLKIAKCHRSRNKSLHDIGWCLHCEMMMWRVICRAVLFVSRISMSVSDGKQACNRLARSFNARAKQCGATALASLAPRDCWKQLFFTLNIINVASRFLSSAS